MKITDIIESKRWVNVKNGRSASIYGAIPWVNDTEKQDWVIEVVGYTWRLDNGTVGLGRTPVKTLAEALAVMVRFNNTD